MKKIFLLAGHSNSDPGAIAGNTTEANETKALRNAIVAELKLLGLYPQVDDDSKNLAAVIRDIKSGVDDLILDLHFNSFTNPQATGVESIVPDRANREEKALGNQLAVKVSEILQIRNRGTISETQSKRGRLAIMQPAGNNVLLELCFLSNPNDMASYRKHFTSLTKQIALVIAEYVKK